MSARLKTILSITVGGLFVYWFAHKLNWAEVWAEVRKADWVLLGLAVALLVGTYFVRVLRWRALLEGMARPSLAALFRATMIGFSALFVMGRAGEMIIRPAVLSAKERVHPSASFATVMIERVFDMVAVVVFFAVNLAFFEYREHDAEAMRKFGLIKITGFVLLGAAALGIYGLSLFARRSKGALGFLERKLKWLPAKGFNGLMSLLRHISEGLGVLHDARELTVTVSYTVVLWLMVALAHLLVVRAFAIDYSVVPFTGAVFVMGLSMLGSVVPTPGGATGPFHIATAAALAFLGVEQDKAASVAIILHPILFAPATIFGLYYIAREGLSLERLKRSGTRRRAEADKITEIKEQESDKIVALQN